jgi:hypothetical protein
MWLEPRGGSVTMGGRRSLRGEFMMRCVRWSVAGVLLLAAGRVAVAQDTQPSTAEFPLIPYADAGFGFEMQLPAGWDYDRSRFQRFQDSIGLLRGYSPDKRRNLEIQVFRSFEMKPFEDWVIEFGKALATLTNSTRVDWETIQLPPRAGAVLSYAARSGAERTVTLCACFPFDPNTVWVLIYVGQLWREEDAPLVRAEFDRLVSTLKIHYDPKEAERLAPALDRGKVLLDKLRTRARDVQVDDTPRYYEMRVEDKPVGYLFRRTTREEYVFSKPDARRRYAKDGLRVRERSWRFGDDGTVRYARLDLFSAFDMRSELIEFQLTQVPAPDVEPQKLLVKTDQVVREDDVLFSSFTTNLDRGLPDPSKPVQVGPVYLDLAWVRLLPGLLLTEPTEPHAVAIYNTSTRALIAHRIHPRGPQRLPGQHEEVFAFEVRDGFIEQAGTLYTDRRGNMVRYEANGLVFRAVTKREVEQRYGPRRDAAVRRFGLQVDE